MFTIKLGTNNTFNVATFCEAYRQAFVDSNDERMVLTMEKVEPENNIDWYMEKLNEEGALNTIEAKIEGEVCATAVGYTTIEDVSIRLLPTGEQSLSITLSKPVA